MSKILVTGGHGFIGSHLCERLVKDGHNVFIYDNKFNRKVIGIARTTVLTSEDFTTERWDYVIHLAAVSKVMPNYTTAMVNSNIIFARKVLSMPCRILYASSTAVTYKESINTYAWTKQDNEAIAALHPCATGMRFQNVYGSRDNGAVGKLIHAAIYNKPITIYGGFQERDFIYIDDVVNSIIDNMDNPAPIVEIGTGIKTKIFNLVELIERISGKTIQYDVQLPKTYEPSSSVCPSPLLPHTALEDGVKKCYLYLTV